MATIREVAKLAGVSVGTVSNVITGAVPVREELRTRIQQAIQDLDYHPNHIARSLKTSRTRTLGIVVPDMTIPFFPRVMRGAEAAARAKGYSVLSVNSDDSASRQGEMLSLLRSQRVDGILLVTAAEEGSVAQIPRLMEAGIPVVCLDRIADGIDVDSVCVEDCAAADLGVTHLLSAGHRQIALFTGPLSLRNERERVRGYREALKRRGIKANASLIVEAGFQPEKAVAACRKSLLNGKIRPTAAFCTNGVTALAVLKGALACGLDIPEDLAFASFDELISEDLFRPSLTAVVQPAYEIGFRATEILLQRIEERTCSGPRIAVRLPATLKIRESSLPRVAKARAEV